VAAPQRILLPRWFEPDPRRSGAAEEG
jgi:hypothetical protein